MTPLRIFVGYDARESVAWYVLAHSILRRASAPVSLIPIVRNHLGKCFSRERGPLESTDFSISRFLVPYLSGYEGVSIFMDCDMLCLTDIVELFKLTAHGGHVYESVLNVDVPAVWVVKHEYTPKGSSKFLGAPNRAYRCKNWSSLMVFRNDVCRALTPEYVNSAHGLELHQFFWLGKDGERKIGPLPLEWNWLVGEYPHNADAKILHYTLGGPWFAATRGSDHAAEWFAELADLGAPPTYSGQGTLAVLHGREAMVRASEMQKC